MVAAPLLGWIDRLELPKKLDEIWEWYMRHPWLFFLTAILIAGAWFFRPRNEKVFFITKRAKVWVHHPLKGDDIAEYHSLKKALTGATAYHKDGHPGELYTLDSKTRQYMEIKY